MQSGEQALSSIKHIWPPKCSKPLCPAVSVLKPLTQCRKAESLYETPIDIPHFLETFDDTLETNKSTVLYLAYGSNLSAETFKDARGIRPFSQSNVLVPSLNLTFDLPGIPYVEPCFANTSLRSPDGSDTKDYHKLRWRKGLVGVVYEVSLKDFHHIIATEGGGGSYQDVVVNCYDIPAGTEIVDPHPSNAPFKAHTLFAPQDPQSSGRVRSKGRFRRPDLNYAQPSARYLKLIADGAAEHALPGEYQNYLSEIRPYTITSKRQAVGRILLIAVWFPIFQLIIALGKIFQDKNGINPPWLTFFMGFFFSGMWKAYDLILRRMFGDGERTQKADGDGDKVFSHSDTQSRSVINEKFPLMRDS